MYVLRTTILIWNFANCKTNVLNIVTMKIFDYVTVKSEENAVHWKESILRKCFDLVKFICLHLLYEVEIKNL